MISVLKYFLGKPVQRSNCNSVKPVTYVISEQNKIQEQSIGALLSAVRNNGYKAEDLGKFLAAFQQSGNKGTIVLVLKYPDIELATVVAGRVSKSEYQAYNNKLLVRFKTFSNEDRKAASDTMNQITGGNPRKHNPMYSVYAGGEVIEIVDGEHEVKGIYFEDTSCENMYVI